MKIQNLFYGVAIFFAAIFMVGCGGAGGGVKAKVDPKLFENKEEVQKIYEQIIKTMGDQVSKADEVEFYITNPADKGKTGDAYLYILTDMQDPKNPKQLVRHLFHGELGYWMAPQAVTVELTTASDEEKQNFKLENQLFDFSKQAPFEKLFKIMQDAYAKENNDPAKFSYRYIERVQVNQEGFNISVTGKLASNDQVIHSYYDIDSDGNFKK